MPDWHFKSRAGDIARDKPANFRGFRDAGGVRKRLLFAIPLDGKYLFWYGQQIDMLKRLPAQFYRTGGGREPVREWLQGLDAADRKIIGEDIKDVEFSWPIGMPVVRSLGEGIWEVRSSLSGGRIARVLFCIETDCMVLLHGFMKKTQKTPPQEIHLAIKRMKGNRA